MSVPTYQDFLLPLLQIANDKKEHLLHETIDHLAKQFNLSEQDKQELLPSGRQTKFSNRVGWAITYLKKARLLESGKRGTFSISVRGIDVLKTKPKSIDRKFLERFPEFIEFQNIKQDSDPSEVLLATEIDQTGSSGFKGINV